MNERQPPAGQGSDSEATRVLREARAKVARGWCRFAEARDRCGADVEPDSPAASQWCSNGALTAVAPGETGGAYLLRATARRILKTAVGCDTITAWNDTVAADKAEVLAAFDKAIALASGASVPERHPQ